MVNYLPFTLLIIFLWYKPAGAQEDGSGWLVSGAFSTARPLRHININPQLTWQQDAHQQFDFSLGYFWLKPTQQPGQLEAPENVQQLRLGTGYNYTHWFQPRLGIGGRAGLSSTFNSNLKTASIEAAPFIALRLSPRFDIKWSPVQIPLAVLNVEQNKSEFERSNQIYFVFLSKEALPLIPQIQLQYRFQPWTHGFEEPSNTSKKTYRNVLGAGLSISGKRFHQTFESLGTVTAGENNNSESEASFQLSWLHFNKKKWRAWGIQTTYFQNTQSSKRETGSTSPVEDKFTQWQFGLGPVYRFYQPIMNDRLLIFGEGLLFAENTKFNKAELPILWHAGLNIRPGLWWRFKDNWGLEVKSGGWLNNFFFKKNKWDFYSSLDTGFAVWDLAVVYAW